MVYDKTMTPYTSWTTVLTPHPPLLPHLMTTSRPQTDLWLQPAIQDVTIVHVITVSYVSPGIHAVPSVYHTTSVFERLCLTLLLTIGRTTLIPEMAKGNNYWFLIPVLCFITEY